MALEEWHRLALADALYVVRKSFRWTGAVLDWIVGDVQNK